MCTHCPSFPPYYCSCRTASCPKHVFGERHIASCNRRQQISFPLLLGKIQTLSGKSAGTWGSFKKWTVSLKHEGEMNRKSLWKSRFKGVKARRSRTGPAAKKKHIHQTFAWAQSAITLRGVNTPSQVVQGLGHFFRHWDMAPPLRWQGWMANFWIPCGGLSLAPLLARNPNMMGERVALFGCT